MSASEVREVVWIFGSKYWEHLKKKKYCFQFKKKNTLKNKYVEPGYTITYQHNYHYYYIILLTTTTNLFYVFCESSIKYTCSISLLTYFHSGDHFILPQFDRLLCQNIRKISRATYYSNDWYQKIPKNFHLLNSIFDICVRRVNGAEELRKKYHYRLPHEDNL